MASGMSLIAPKSPGPTARAEPKRKRGKAWPTPLRSFWKIVVKTGCAACRRRLRARPSSCREAELAAVPSPATRLLSQALGRIPLPPDKSSNGRGRGEVKTDVLQLLCDDLLLARLARTDGDVKRL